MTVYPTDVSQVVGTAAALQTFLKLVLFYENVSEPHKWKKRRAPNAKCGCWVCDQSLLSPWELLVIFLAFFYFPIEVCLLKNSSRKRTHRLMTDFAFSFISSLLGKQARLTTCLKLKSVAIAWVLILSMLRLEMKMEPLRYSALVLTAVARAV